MKRTTIITALMAIAMASAAQAADTGADCKDCAGGATANANAASKSLSASAALSGSASQSEVNVSSPNTTTNVSRVSGKTRLVTPPTVIAPALAAAGIEACLGSVSGGVSVMGGGVSFGSTTKDDDCNRRLYARQLHNMGYKAAAVALQCLSPEVQWAMAAAGTPCPGLAPPVAAAPVVTAFASLGATAGVSPAPAGYKWVPNPEYAIWVEEQKSEAKPARVRKGH
jgi:hypothetical protein